jgi:hypothetical protein
MDKAVQAYNKTRNEPLTSTGVWVAVLGGVQVDTSDERVLIGRPQSAMAECDKRGKESTVANDLFKIMHNSNGVRLLLIFHLP